MMFPDILSVATSAVGLGLQIFGGHKASEDASRYAQQEAQFAQQGAAIAKDEARQEQSINDLKQRQMEIEGNRTQIENIRNMQRARALGINSAVNQGAQYGSGLAGGLADTENQANFNILGVSQALGIGRGINNYNQAISYDKMQAADLRANQQTQQAFYQARQAQNQGLMSLGGALLKAGPSVGPFAKQAGGNNFNFLFGGGSPSGYG